MLSDDVLLEGGQILFASAWADAWEEVGGRLRPGTAIETYAPKAPPERLLPLMRGVEATLSKALGKDLDEVFVDLDVDPDKWWELFYYMGQSLQGAGIGPDDFFYDNYPDTDWKEKYPDLCPDYDDLYQLRDLADQVIEEDLARDQEPENLYWGDSPILVESYLPTGETLRGMGWAMKYLDDMGKLVVLMDDNGVVPEHLRGRFVIVDDIEVSAA